MADHLRSIREFIHLRRCDGTPTWPRHRAEAEISRYTAAIHRAAGFAR